jgi:DNA repair exonuclease SbcCD ATPase subunit
LLAAAVGGFYGFRELEGNWRDGLLVLEAKLADLEKIGKERQTALAQAIARIEETDSRLRQSKEENSALARKLEETRSHLEQTRRSLDELRLQKERIEEDLGRLKRENASVLEGLLKQLEKLFDAGATSTPPGTGVREGEDEATDEALAPAGTTPQAE